MREIELQSGLEVVPARPHKPFHVGASPTSATKLICSSVVQSAPLRTERPLVRVQSDQPS
jgi:hypothetical protein